MKNKRRRNCFKKNLIKRIPHILHLILSSKTCALLDTTENTTSRSDNNTKKTHQARQTNNTINIQVSHYALDHESFDSHTAIDVKTNFTIRRICDNRAKCAKTEQRIHFMFVYIYTVYADRIIEKHIGSHMSIVVQLPT